MAKGSGSADEVELLIGIFSIAQNVDHKTVGVGCVRGALVFTTNISQSNTNNLSVIISEFSSSCINFVIFRSDTVAFVTLFINDESVSFRILALLSCRDVIFTEIELNVETLVTTEFMCFNLIF